MDPDLAGLDRADLGLDGAGRGLDPAHLDLADLARDPERADLDRLELHLRHWKEMPSSSWPRSKSWRKARRVHPMAPGGLAGQRTAISSI